MTHRFGRSIGRMSGLSLIELMIALVLGLILTLGATQIYLSTSQSFRLTDGVAHAQETVRFATAMLQKDIRSAGGLACLQDTSDVDVKLNGDTVIPLDQGVMGWEAAGSGAGDSLTLSTSLPADASDWSEGSGDGVFPDELKGEVVQDTDVLIINAVQTAPVSVSGSSTGSISLDSESGIPQGRLVLAVNDNCSGGELFQKANQGTALSITIAGTGFDPGNKPSSGFDLNYSTDARVSEFSTKAFYIGIGTSGEPSLMMQRLGSEPEAPQELVEGVESMQVLYGVSTGVIRQVDQYVTADNVTDWSAVMSVRLSFVVRSGDNANSEDVTRVFDVLGTEITSPADRRARLLASTTVGLRNRLE